MTFSPHKPIDLSSKIEDFKNQPCFLAISGGLDSVVLLHLLLARNIRPTLLHVNYKLRDKDSELDEKLVCLLAEKYQLPIHIKSVHLKEVLEKSKENLQAKAREIRFHFFEEHLGKNGVCFLAHHADDRLESFWMNLLRGSRQIDLVGIPEKRGPFYRPLLKFRKSQLKEYAVTNKISWREDRSNSDTAYFRNLLRNEWIPIAQSSIENLDEHCLIWMDSLQSTVKNIKIKLRHIVKESKANNSLSFTIFLAFDELERQAFFRMMDWPMVYLESLIELDNKPRSSSLIMSEVNLVFAKEIDSFSWKTLDSTQNESRGLNIELVKDLPEKFSKDTIYLDSSEIIGELKLRKWKVGDRIASLGLKGSQLISDILKDAKVSILEKKDVLVVCDDRHILWCPGYKVSRYALANQTSTKILKISIKE